MATGCGTKGALSGELCFSCVSNRKMSLGYTGSRDGNGINTAPPPARCCGSACYARPRAPQAGGLGLLPSSTPRRNQTNIRALLNRFDFHQRLYIILTTTAAAEQPHFHPSQRQNTHTRAASCVCRSPSTTLGSLPYAVSLSFSLRFDGTLDTKPNRITLFLVGGGGQKGGSRTPGLVQQ